MRALHEAPRLLVLPNIWEPLGARLLERSGYPAVATASAAIAWSLGQEDGERIGLDLMLQVVQRIVRSVEVPVTADLEAGYAEEPAGVADNALRLLQAGAVGVNLEDSCDEGERFFSIEDQCRRNRAVREMAAAQGVPLFINARIDVFLAARWEGSDRLEATIDRGKAYREAGADCLYPIPVGDVTTLQRIRDGCGGAMLNAYATAGSSAMSALERAGVQRLSLGPGLIKASLTAMRRVVEGLRDYGPYDGFTTEALSSEEAASYTRRPSGRRRDS